MANTAEIFNFPVPDVAQKEPRVADLDDGYTRIANELLEAVMLAGLTQHQLLGNDSNLLIVFYVQIMPDDFVMQLHRF